MNPSIFRSFTEAFVYYQANAALRPVFVTNHSTDPSMFIVAPTSASAQKAYVDYIAQPLTKIDRVEMASLIAKEFAKFTNTETTTESICEKLVIA